MNLLLNRQTFGNPADKGNVISKEAAMEILQTWVLNERLRLHMKQVGHLMASWAKEIELFDEEDQWRWQLAGLLHDADWDHWPDQHCKKIIEELEHRHVDPEILHAIASHGPAHFGVEPETKMDKMLCASLPYRWRLVQLARKRERVSGPTHKIYRLPVSSTLSRQFPYAHLYDCKLKTMRSSYARRYA